MAGGTLARAAGDFITLVQLIEEAPALPDPAALRQQLLHLLEGLRRAEGVDPEEVEEARFALVAWADEVILRSTWSGRDQWEGHTLQMQLYRTSKAGNEFYDHLARLRPDQNAAREVYFLVLALGFQGQYVGQEAERRALVSHQYDTLRASGGVLETARERKLLPTAYQLDVDLDSRRGGVLLYLGLTAAGVLLLYGVFWVVLALVAADVPPPVGG